MRSRSPIRPWLALLSAVLLYASAAAGQPQCERIVAMGDQHGGFDECTKTLRMTGLVDAELNWNGGAACLVQLGDITDRGAESRKILELMISLDEQAPGQVYVLLGNHEVMNIVGDLRYVHPMEFAAFAGEERPADREAGLAAFQQLRDPFVNGNGDPKELFHKTYPPGWFAHRKAFAPGGRYGAWLLSRPVAVVLDHTLFVHGGISPEDAARGLEEINETVARELREYHRLREQLIESGWLNPLLSYKQSAQMINEAVMLAADSDATRVDEKALAVAEQFLGWYSAAIYSQARGPLWNRELALADELEHLPHVNAILYPLRIRRIVVAHTPTDDGRVAARFKGRVFVIDTGAGPAYEGNRSALEILGNGTVRAVYSDKVVTLADPLPSDEEIAEFLRNAEITHGEEIGTGITKPYRLTLERDGVQMTAAFKYVDDFTPGLTRFRSGAEMNFSDSYKYDRVAYLLDRQLGLGMVPVAVLREYDKKQGAVIQWVAGTIDEQERYEQNLKPPDQAVLIRQRAVMKVWDVLIGNTDRNLGNQLYTTDDWQLHLIDHSRCFRLGKKLPKAFLNEPVSLPRELLPKLEALEVQQLQRYLEGLVSKAQIKAMLSRRNQIVEKIERDREAYGDVMVFF